ncbi:MAG: tRNA threonylcarbamoyladenosine biosynthesis protein TsaB [Saliniramus fredricksonii]|uniref:tRNA threonylcarbamoyl adenosine modification protein YeaZ n=1 Tax=Saliniramus fredricksonii TaxID=1653334 RepID=A0A0P7X5F7_9HYPH|nr:tRNA (adenosine(37)-N6)-threonylcarbamoyltransferase complex dimerization subunit type 1 TsaB [Saliniramus fredricksonii]KPQ10091.1 MAG: tRNA threonylcarbamoyladenosine biosynthesis protein TsaB [Saliniramus fredricksonii]SCC80609.1 tRNA threonylcarbamoyl adenosine modification protein YeaZ [Saliniramus fredricksonii]
MRVLAIDTALGACSACILDAGAADPLAVETLTMERGHAEALMPLIGRVAEAVPGGFESIDRVAVTIGPGSFTGMRVGISAARAIGLAADVPVVGVTTLSALLAPLVAAGDRRLIAAAIDARHGAVYFQAVAPGGRSVVAPAHIGIREAVRYLGSGPVVLTGSAASLIAAEAMQAGVSVSSAHAEDAPDILFVARLGMAADPAQALPKPFYLRAPDARPQDAARIARR